jgi:hypothetical protein
MLVFGAETVVESYAKIESLYLVRAYEDIISRIFD